MTSGNVLGTGVVSVLPATTAYVLFPSLHSASIAVAVVAVAGLWALSYVGVNSAVRFIKK